MLTQPTVRLAARNGRLTQDPHSQPGSLRQAMRLAAGAVSVVTAGLDEARTGATVTTAQSLSTEPETMLVSINLTSSTYAAIERFRHFCVNLLSAEQVDIANRFSGFSGAKGVERYEGASWTTLETGAGALDGALSSIDCEVEEIVPRHSHALILGRVRAVVLRPGPALLYRNGTYSTFD